MDEDQKIPLRNSLDYKVSIKPKNYDFLRQTEELDLDEEFFRNIFENASLGMAIQTCDGRFALTNSSFNRMLGFGPGELIGVHCSAVIPPEDAFEHDEWYRKFMDSGLPSQSYEKRYICKDGRLIWAEVSVSCIRDEANQILFSIVIARDITVRVNMEEALRVSENRFRRLAENARDILFILSLPDGKYEYISPAVFDIWGYTPEELYSDTLDIKHIIHPDFREFLKQQRENLLQGKEVPAFYEFKIIHKNGTEKWVHQRNVPIRNHEGSLIALEGIMTDITDRKLMEEALARSEHRFRTLSEASLEAIVFIEDGIIVDANEALNRLFGYEKEDFRGKLATDFIAPEKRDFTDKRIRTHTEGIYETIGLRKDGSVFPVEVNPRELEHSGKKLRISAVRDLTERYKLENQLKDHQKHLEQLVEERTNKLKESEEKFRNIFEDAVVGIYQSTPEGRFLTVNLALARMYGYNSPEELLQSVTNIATEIYHDPQRRIDFMELAERDGIVRNFEAQVRTRDGSTKYVSINAHAIKDKKGKVLYYEGIIFDITQKKLFLELIILQRDLAAKLSQIDNLEGGIPAILQAAMAASGMECGGILLKNNETDGFDLIYSMGLSHEFQEKIRHVHTGSFTWKRMMEKKSFHIRPCKEYTPIALEEGFQFLSVMPMLQGDTVFGFLVTASKMPIEIPEQVRIGLEILAAESGNIIASIQARKQLEEEIMVRKEAEKRLECEHRDLEEANIALKVLLKYREEDKRELEDKLIANVRNLIFPFVQKLKASRLDPYQKMTADLIESNLHEIVSPFLNNLRALNFTPRQLEVISLIKEGKTTKDIAQFLGVGKDAVDLQRLLIRKKLGINNKKANLRSYLQSFT
jgi:PAS domain S-box-containing protein